MADGFVYEVVVNTLILNTVLAFSHSENENRKQKKKVGKKRKNVEKMEKMEKKGEKNVHSFPSLAFQDKCQGKFFRMSFMYTKDICSSSKDWMMLSAELS